MKKLGLFIGIDNYGKEFTPLRGAVNDANELAGLFRYSLGFEVRVLAKERVGQSDVTTALSELVETLNEGDLFVFFFAGHGKSRPQPDRTRSDQILVMSEAKRLALEEGHSEGTIGLRWVESVTRKKGVQRALIIDACRTPLEIEKANTRDGEDNFVFDGEAAFRDIVFSRARVGAIDSPLAVFNSCRHHQRAIELRNKSSGLFTTSMIEVVLRRVENNRSVVFDQSFEDDVAQSMLSVARDNGIVTEEQRPLRDGAELCLFDANDRQHRDLRLLMARFESQLSQGSIDEPMGECARDTLAQLDYLNVPKEQLVRLRERCVQARLNEEVQKLAEPLKQARELAEDKAHRDQARPVPIDDIPVIQQVASFRTMEPIMQVKGCPLVCGQMACIEAGSFEIGAAEGEPDDHDYEKPRHQVTLKAFEIGRTVVTQGQWKAVMDGANPSRFKDGDAYPVECVAWDDTQEFLKRLNERTGKKYRLPSEAEWEMAARAGSSTAFWWGNSINPKQANYNGNATYNGGEKGKYRERTVSADSFEANAWGLYNVHGNVWEWVQDRWHNNYEGAPNDGIAWEDGVDTRRVLRGGSWGDDPWGLRSADRDRNSPDYRDYCGGFRLVRTLVTP